jgi:hypothetical protein
MKKNELYIPVGWLSLTKDQSEQLESAGKKAISQLPIYSVVALAPEDQVLPVYGIPGLEAVILHYEKRIQSEKAIVGQNVIAALLKEVDAGGAQRPFVAHTKLVAPLIDPSQQNNQEQAKKESEKESEKEPRKETGGKLTKS